MHSVIISYRFEVTVNVTAHCERNAFFVDHLGHLHCCFLNCCTYELRQIFKDVAFPYYRWSLGVVCNSLYGFIMPGVYFFEYYHF